MTTSTTNLPHTTSNNGPRKRYRPVKQLQGYPHGDTPLPTGLTQHDIITGYPNHLRGKLLLQIAGNWAPSEIAATCSASEISVTTICKRLYQARKESDPENQPRQQKRRKNQLQRDGEEDEDRAAATDPPSESLFLPDESVTPNPGPAATQPPLPTQSGTEFFDQDQLATFRRRGEELLHDQGGILRHAEAIDPDFQDRNWLPYKKRKENAPLDRGVVNRAVELWEAEKEAGGEDSGTGGRA